MVLKSFQKLLVNLCFSEFVFQVLNTSEFVNLITKKFESNRNFTYLALDYLKKKRKNAIHLILVNSHTIFSMESEMDNFGYYLLFIDLTRK